MNRLGPAVVALAIATMLGAGAIAVAGDMDHVKMSGGKMIVMQSGKPDAPMDHEMTMSDGTIVTPDGTVRLKDGKVMQLKSGEMVMMDGHVMRGGKAAAMCH
ncbi:MAG TPA: DUF6799 domain-containing protein [Candidatus Acidoferrales bacterium]|nr:DUF6799 domain-containing protein [Candidatus Acidoferrales bacterium]